MYHSIRLYFISAVPDILIAVTTAAQPFVCTEYRLGTEIQLRVSEKDRRDGCGEQQYYAEYEREFGVPEIYGELGIADAIL